MTTAYQGYAEHIFATAFANQAVAHDLAQLLATLKDGMPVLDPDHFGVFGVEPASQVSAYNQVYAATSKSHNKPTADPLNHAGIVISIDGSLATVTSTYDAMAINKNFKECATVLDKLIADVANLKQVVNSIIDDMETYGFFPK